MVRESFNHQLKHLISMQYSTAELRLRALEDVLAGPQGLHRELGSKIGEVRELAREFTDARLEKDPEAFPPARVRKPRKKNDIGEPAGRIEQLGSAVIGSLRQLLAPRELSPEVPEHYVAARDARWFRLARMDSAVVTMPDGTSAALYQRDPERFRDLLSRSVEVHQRLMREWPQLAHTYREQLADITSPETWEKTLRAPADPEEEGRP
jgi:galactofuranosylgalactofuranosylrhamnosyl-N-acetylglucosaminyl-diphospho-decaprenol beta-1,5/1,6-galactofuranosyltransferase